MATKVQAKRAKHEIPTLAGVRAAARRLERHLSRSPAYRSLALSQAFNADVWLQVETVNPIGCFKLRGALNSLLATKAAGKTLTGAVTSSTGNHGQGVAYAAKLLGVACHIFVPKGANPAKVQRIQALGATVIEGGADIDEAKESALGFAKRQGFTFVDDGEDLEMMHGAGTVGLELIQTVEKLDHVFVPMGSGTLAAGCAAAIKGIHGSAKLTAVQPTGSPAMHKSFHAKKPIEAPISTIADGLVCRVPAKRALDAILALLDDVVLVDDAQLLSAMRTLVETDRLLVEPSGAAGLAAAWKQRDTLRSKRVGLVLTGSNLAPGILERALAAPPLIPR